MRPKLRHLMLVLVLGALGAASVFALWPRSVEVETAPVERGPLRVTVDEDGRTRIKEKYTISSPLAGRLARVALDVGDAVIAGQTVLAVVNPVDPSLLDSRARAEAEARVRAAEAALERAGAAVRRAGAAMELAQGELNRLKQAESQSAASVQEMQRAVAEDSMRREEYRAAGFERDIAQFELDQARAALQVSSAGEDPVGRFEIVSPVDGRVLRLMQESAAVVQAGTPLIEVGDPADLEVVIDVLSSDAVQIRPGAEAIIEQWGGETPLRGRVRIVEPAAFTKISALGVEEQRVNVIIDFLDAPDARASLGDGFRVEASIVVWEGTGVLQVPTAALFRNEKSWAVYVISDGRSESRDISIGRRNSEDAQIESGLAAGDIVIVYPGDQVRDGTRVTARTH